MNPTGPQETHPRQKLMQATLAVIDEQSPYDFSLSTVTRRAQLSAEVLGQHFASKNDLILAIAEEGYAQLAENLEQWMTRGTDAMERVNLCACAYVDFALTHPRHFAILFDLPPALRDLRTAEPSAMNAFGVLVRALEQAQAEGCLPAGDAALMARRLWPLVHGIAKLALAGVLPMPHDVLIEETRQAAAMFTRGLSLSAPVS